MTKDKAQNAPIIWTTFGLFYNGQLISHEIMSANKFEKVKLHYELGIYHLLMNIKIRANKQIPIKEPRVNDQEK